MDQFSRLGKSIFICYCLLVIMWFLLERFVIPLGAWDGLRYFIVALPVPSILLFLWTAPKLDLQSRRISDRKGIINQTVGQSQS